MTAHIHQFLSGTLIVLVIVNLVLANARPGHFGDTVQGVAEPSSESGGNLLDSGLKPWQLELLAQRIAEIGQQPSPALVDDYGWERIFRDRGIRSPENKRQSRYRQCYFNPISCFRK